MDLNSRAKLIGGMVMILAALLTIIPIILTALTATSRSEDHPSNREEVAGFLTNLADNQDAMIAAGAVAVVNDAVFTLALAALVFVLFRDRSSVLATVSLVTIAAAGTISASNDILGIVMTYIAEDFVVGGPEGVPAGDPAILELGRFLGMLNFSMVGATFAAAGLGFFSLGMLLALAPSGVVNPPRWLGWVAVVSGLACWLAPLMFLAEPGFVFFPIQLLSMLILLFGLGGWLIAHSGPDPTLPPVDPMAP